MNPTNAPHSMKTNLYFWLSVGLSLLAIGLLFVPAAAGFHFSTGWLLLVIALLGALAAIGLGWARAFSTRRWQHYLGAVLKTAILATALPLALLSVLVAHYIHWAGETEQQGRENGTALTTEEALLAADVGVQSPHEVRLVHVKQVPFPMENPALKYLGETLGFIGDGVVNNAQVFGYSIYVRQGFALDRPKLAHELVHVRQIEDTSFQAITIQHMLDLALHGYENSRIENEAFQANRKYALPAE